MGKASDFFGTKLSTTFRCAQFGKFDGYDAELLGTKLVKGWGRLYKIKIFEENSVDDWWIEYLPHIEIAERGDFKKLGEK
jgi:hypothetical protein